MARQELRYASDALREAIAVADSEEAEDQLGKHADRLARFATADRGPDHGTLARVERQVSRVADQADSDIGGLVDEAIGHVHAYREELDGV